MPGWTRHSPSPADEALGQLPPSAEDRRVTPSERVQAQVRTTRPGRRRRRFGAIGGRSAAPGSFPVDAVPGRGVTRIPSQILKGDPQTGEPERKLGEHVIYQEPLPYSTINAPIEPSASSPPQPG